MENAARRRALARVQLGGQLFVYANACEARVHEIGAKWLFFVGLFSMFGAIWLARYRDDHDG